MRISVWSHRAASQRRSPEIARDLLRRAIVEHVGHEVPVEHHPGLPPKVEGLAVSLSRTEDVAMCAVAGCEAIGIDVEQLKPWDQLAEIASLIDHAEPGDARELLALWTRKEALSKALGTGLPDDVRTLETPQDPSEIGAWRRSGGWLWLGCPCEDGCVASLVIGNSGPDDRGTVDITESRQTESGVRVWTISPRL